MVLSVDMLSMLVEMIDEHRDEHPLTLSNTTKCELQKQERYNQLNPRIMAIIYSIIFIFSTFGNVTVIFVMLFRARTRSVTSMLITNLAVSDLLLCFTSLWITPMYFYFNWSYGALMCKLFPLIQSASVFNSALTLLAISVDRYYSVCRHDNSTRRIFTLTPKTCSLLILAIWTISITLALPYGLYMNVVQRECGLRCIEIWGNDNILNNMEIRVIYGFVAMIFQFILPMAFIGYSYCKIYIYLKRRCKQSNFRLRIVSTKKSSLFRMLFIMVSAFAICWLPMTLLNMMRDLHLIKYIKPFAPKFMISHVIAMFATMANPLIYAFMNLTFRDEFARIAPELHVKLFHSLCRKRNNEDKAGNQKQLGRPLLDMNHPVERVALTKQLNGMVEMRRNSSCSSLNVQNRPNCLPEKGISTSETTPNQNSPN